MVENATIKRLDTEGFVTSNEGTVAPGAYPMFEEIRCPWCKNKLLMGHENVIVMRQTGHEDIKLFIHYVCLKSMMVDLEKDMAKQGAH